MTQEFKPRKKYEFNCLLENAQQREISKNKNKRNNFKATVFTISTEQIPQKDFEKIVYGGSFGYKACLKIEVVQEKQSSESGSHE